MTFQGVFFFSKASRINFVKCLFKSFTHFLIIGCLFFLTDLQKVSICSG